MKNNNKNSSKLGLNRETVRSLDAYRLAAVNGGKDEGPGLWTWVTRGFCGATTSCGGSDDGDTDGSGGVRG